MKNSLDFDIKKASEMMDLSLDETTRAVALSVYRGVTLKTPVDTGRARANWNLSVSKPDLSVNKNATSIKSAHLNKGDGKQDIWITNNLPYIKVLENGSSKQAPKGMVAVTMNEVRSQFT